MGVITAWPKQSPIDVELFEDAFGRSTVDLMTFSFIEHIVVLSNATTVHSKGRDNVEHRFLSVQLSYIVEPYLAKDIHGAF